MPRRQTQPHDTALLVLLGFVIALGVGPVYLYLAGRAEADVRSYTSASNEASAYEEAVKGGFDGRDDQLVTFGDEDERERAPATATTPAKPAALTSDEGEPEEERTLQADPALLF